MSELEHGLWLSISEVADETGVSHQAVSKRVRTLEAQGRLKSRHGHNGRKEINLAQYMVAIRAVGDPAREQAVNTRRALRQRNSQSDGCPVAEAMVDLVDFLIADKEHFGSAAFTTPSEYILAKEIQRLRARLLLTPTPGRIDDEREESRLI